MRTLAIGDVHGCDTALAALLDLVRPESDDTVVILGDVIDRGPGSRQCIERLIVLGDECRVVRIMGNHEEMLLGAIAKGGSVSWLCYGGKEMLASYGEVLEDIPPEHVHWIEEMQDHFETETEIFVHANWDASLPADQQQPGVIRWDHLSGNEQPVPGKRVVCGHSSQKDGRPKTLPGWVCIDTFAYGMQWLTCLDVGSDLVHRANELGQTEGPLPLADVALPFRAKS